MNKHILYAGTIQKRLIYGVLKRHFLAAPPTAIGRDDNRGVRSCMRTFKASAEKPPKTTLCVIPKRAQASSAMGSSGTMGM